MDIDRLPDATEGGSLVGLVALQPRSRKAQSNRSLRVVGCRRGGVANNKTSWDGGC